MGKITQNSRENLPYLKQEINQESGMRSEECGMVVRRTNHIAPLMIYLAALLLIHQ